MVDNVNEQRKGNKMIDWNKPIRTKGGETARLLCLDYNAEHGNDRPVVVAIKSRLTGLETLAFYTKEGKTLPTEGRESDLENIPETRQVWINFYDLGTHYSVHLNHEDAESFVRKYAEDRPVSSRIRLDFENGKISKIVSIPLPDDDPEDHDLVYRPSGANRRSHTELPFNPASEFFGFTTAIRGS